MLPYLSIGERLLSDSAKRRILAYLSRTPDAIQPYVSSVLNRYDGLSKATTKALSVIAPEIIELRRRISLPFVPAIMAIQPHTCLHRHTDSLSGGRLSSIIDPISDAASYAPLHFWHDLMAEAPSAVVDIKDLPAIVDLQTLHSVDNQAPTLRLNFQVSFAAPFHQVVELHRAGRLIQPAQASL